MKKVTKSKSVYITESTIFPDTEKSVENIESIVISELYY